ncbi:MAG: sodium:proton antiporter NhaD [Chitinophagaceae bacterium]|nr:sodium:proton antiporter NhaD [Chitinophagaceae bacterium]
MLIAVFVIGYLLIALEEITHINKSAIALITGVGCWTVLFLTHSGDHLGHDLINHLGEISGILFFLIGAMTIVELIDVLVLLSFFLSAVLDNLTTTIVLISILLKIIQDPKEKIIYASLIVVSANAGGVWSPIGDVTTTMLWMGNQITTAAIIKSTFIASLLSVIIPLIALSFKLKGDFQTISSEHETSNLKSRFATIFFIAGIAALLFVPVFKSITGLPPFMGMLLAMGMIWLLSELIDKRKDEEVKQLTSINNVLKKIDTPSILFFLGILLAVSALSTAGYLNITMILGISSAVVDNVPLMAAAQNMYDLTIYPTDHPFWLMLAYTTGTGGSLLIIGSAAGIAAMGLTKINFGWYLKNVSFWVLLGYLSGWIWLSMSLGS